MYEKKLYSPYQMLRFNFAASMLDNQATQEPVTPTARSFRWAGSIAFYCISFLSFALIALISPEFRHGSLFGLPNLIGPLVEHLVHHSGYVTYTDAMQTPGNIICFHVHRMPLPPLLLTALIRIFGNHYRAVGLAKIALVLLPVTAAFSLLWRKLQHVSCPRLRWQVPLFLFACLMLPVLMVNVIHMQVEEGYSFCLLAYAISVLLFGLEKDKQNIHTAFSFALAVVGLYLTKSSMILTCAFLVTTYCVWIPTKQLRAIVLCATLCGPLGWGFYSLHVSGRFTLGTSLDGINLHKGNNPKFLERYPPADDGNLDRYDAQLSDGLSFPNEWALSDYHKRASLIYIQAHPAEDLRGDLRKSNVFFFSLRKIGSERYTGIMGLVTLLNMLLFRLLLWSAGLLAINSLWRGLVERRKAAILYVGVVLTVAAPYIVGFALTRHASILVLPSALYLAHWRLTLNREATNSLHLAPAAK